MIFGVGTDLVEVQRVADKVSRNSGFTELVFSQAEIAYCESKTKKYEHYAARFAAKEAFLKALGTGWTGGTSFNEIEIVNLLSGKPALQLSGETAATIAAMKLGKISVSISHTQQLATATVIIEQQ